MANVKISELPNLASLHYDDVIIVNDTSAGTTCKTTVNALVTTNLTITATPIVEGLTFADGTTTKNVAFYPHRANTLLLALNDLNLINPTANALECGWQFTINSEYGYTLLFPIPTLFRNTYNLPNMPNSLAFTAPGYTNNQVHIKYRELTNTATSAVYYLPANSSTSLAAERVLTMIA